MKKNERVGAILSQEDGVIEFLGYGTYVGDEVPYGADGILAETVVKYNIKNPCILLDSGKKVFGCECWWGPEETVKEALAQAKKIKRVDIEEVRRKYREGEL